MERFSYPVNLLIEGTTNEAVVRRILEHVGLPCGIAYGKMGKLDLLKRLQVQPGSPLCALAGHSRSGSRARVRTIARPRGPARSGAGYEVAGRRAGAIESWLLADAERLAKFLSIPISRIPTDPDNLLDPKTALVDLARRSRRRAIREDMVPRRGSGARVGPGYTGRIVEFVSATEQGWRPKVAREYSNSLGSCIKVLQTLKTWKP